MNKDEILSKAQKENIHGDERELLIEVKAHEHSALFAETCCGIMYILTYLAGDARWEYLHATFFMGIAYHGYRAWHFHKKLDMVMALLLGICSIALAFTYVRKIIGW